MSSKAHSLSSRSLEARTWGRRVQVDWSRSELNSSERDFLYIAWRPEEEVVSHGSRWSDLRKPRSKAHELIHRKGKARQDKTRQGNPCRASLASPPYDLKDDQRLQNTGIRAVESQHAVGRQENKVNQRKPGVETTTEHVWTGAGICIVVGWHQRKIKPQLLGQCL